MEPLQVAERIKAEFPDDFMGVEEFRGQVSVTVKKDNIFDICRFLRDDPDIRLDLPLDLTAVDFMGKKPVRFEVVYHLMNVKTRKMLRLKALVPEDDCAIDSITPLYCGMDWHERECFDLFGIEFRNHPDLRRILLPEDWEGHPLRKDYPTEGFSGEKEWRGFKEVLETAKRNKKYEWNA